MLVSLRNAGLALLPFLAALPATAMADIGLGYEKNVGQADASADYLVRAGGYTAFVQPAGLTIMVSETPHEPEVAGERPARLQRHVVSMTLVGAEPHTTAVATGRLPVRSHYFRGRDPQRWLTGIESFAEVAYAELWPGIDLVYHSAGQQLEYDFRVAAGADPNLIRLRFSGGVSPTADGDLAVDTGGGRLIHGAPLVYQHDANGRKRIAGRYVARPDGDFGFELGEYDSQRQLVIDPVLEYSGYLGGSGLEVGADLARDSAGNIYVSGRTRSVDFPLANPQQSGYAGGDDIFVAKFDPSGSTLLYSTYIGGSADDGVNQIGVDSSGAAYVAGYTSSPDFPLANAFQSVLGGGGLFDSDAFVLALAPAGDTLTYSTYLGGRNDLGDSLFSYEWVRGMHVAADGTATLAGETGSPDFPATHVLGGRACLAGEAKVNSPLVGDAFVARFSADGARVFATCLGANARDAGRAIDLDAQGNVWVSGFTRSDAFPVTPDAFQLIRDVGSSAYDLFIAKLNADASAVVYATFASGMSTDFSQSSRVDTDGSYIITGSTWSPDFPVTPGAFQSVFTDPIDGYGGLSSEGLVMKFASDGAIVFSTFLGAPGDDVPFALDVGPRGDIYVAGYSVASVFPGSRPLGGNRGRLYGSARPVDERPEPVLALASAYAFEGSGSSDEVLVAANNGINRVYRRESSSGPWVTTNLGTQLALSRAAVFIDVNGDFNHEVMIGNDGSANRLHPNNGAGGFGPAVSVGAADGATRGLAAEFAGSFVAEARFNQPNQYYPIIANTLAPAISLNDGNSRSTSVAVGHLDATFGADIVVGNDGGPNVIFLATATGFRPGIALSADAQPTRAIRVADVDNDGRLDILSGNYGAVNSVFFRRASGYLRVPLGIETDLTLDLLAVDVDADSDLDIVVANEGRDRLYLYDNDSFALLEDFAAAGTTTNALRVLPSCATQCEIVTAGADGKVLNYDYTPEDLFLAVLDPTGSTLRASVTLGGDGSDLLAWGLTVDPRGDAWLFGNTSGDDFPLAGAPVQPASGGIEDAVLAKIVVDRDADGIFDDHDNCLLVANDDQRDTNGDGFGNRCDADINNDGVVEFSDLNAIKLAFFAVSGDPDFDPDFDLDGDGEIGFSDLNILKLSFFQPPGPSGTQ